MERWTHREYLTRLAWIEEQWNFPSRSDQYLMQVAAEVRRVLSKKPDAVKLEHFKLKFGTVKRKPAQKLTKAQQVKMHFQRWVAVVTPRKSTKKK